MSRDKNNNIFEKTSFLGNNSSEFVETLYTEYLNDPNKLPNQWREFFEGLRDKSEKILINELKIQILDDGAHYELSPMYHSIIIEDLIDILELIRIYKYQNPILIKIIKTALSVMVQVTKGE